MVFDKNENRPISDTPILDACCGSRMIWFGKENENVTFMDNRELDCTLCDGRALNIHPDVIADFRCMPFENDAFSLVVFDPPHLKQVGNKSWLALKYGALSENWPEDIRQGYEECMRVLKPFGTLILKWNEQQVSISEIIKAIGVRPLFGSRRLEKKKDNTIWLVFMKGVV